MTSTKRHKMLILCVYVLGLLSLTSGNSIANRIWKRDIESHETEDDGNKPVVFLTISSLASRSSNQEDRMLELNWGRLPSDFAQNDGWVSLYDKDPLYDSTDPILSTRPKTEEGHFRTSIRFPEQNFSRHNLTDACLDFWIAYIQNEEILSTNCVRARPNWMYQARSVIGNFSLMDLMIPGTHNTGTYASFDDSDDTLFNRYLITQEEDVWHQLVYGIRYLDLRVAYQNSASSSERLWITHSSFVTDIPVKEVIRQVKDFLENTNEIVIMDFHRFVNGFKGRRAARRHQELITVLERELGNYMIPVSFTSWVNLNTLWATGKRLYVGYADDNSRRQNSLLFPAIKHLWGDVDTIAGLKNYLNQTICSQRNRRLTSAMAQLTPTTAGAIFNLYGGLRNMADNINREITKWFRDEWNHCANIVATDFFLGNNIIEISIETNKKREL